MGRQKKFRAREWTIDNAMHTDHGNGLPSTIVVTFITLSLHDTVAKPTNIPLPQMHTEMTHSQFCKFEAEWDVYKQTSHIPTSSIPSQLNHICGDALQHSIVSTTPDYFSTIKSDFTNPRINCYKTVQPYSSPNHLYQYLPT